MNKTICNICLECFPTVEIDRIEEGMTGREVADLLYDNFDKLNQGKADRCVEHTVDNILRDQYNIHNSTAKQKFINEVFYTFAKQDVKDSLADFKELKDNLHDHLVDYNNPHKVTKDQVGLDQVDNTSDKDKPISDAVATAIDELYEAIDAVDERRIDYTVNGYKINTNPILDGNDIELDNYTKVSVDTAIDNDDTVTKAIGKLEYRLEEEVGDRVDALEQEIAARIAADEALSNDITEETHNRIDEDNKLQQNITDLDSKYKGVTDGIKYDLQQHITETNAALNAEQQARLEADTKLQNNIDTESSARQEADKQLQQNIDNLNASLTEDIENVSNDLSTHINNKNNPHEVTKEQVGLGNLTNDVQVKRSEMGVANGVATLNESGQVPSSLLPSYVDDVLEYDTFTSLPDTGETGKIYITLDDNLTYRWSGTQYVEISKSLALGETDSTAFPGNRGKAVEDITNSLPLNIAVGLNRNVETNDDSVLISYEYKTKQGDGTYSVMSSTAACTIPAATTITAGVMSTADKTKLDSLQSNLYVDLTVSTLDEQTFNNIVNAINNKLVIIAKISSTSEEVCVDARVLSNGNLWLIFPTVYNQDDSNDTLLCVQFTIDDSSYSVSRELHGFRLVKNGDGTKYLADDGTYKTIDLTSLDDKYLPLTGGLIEGALDINQAGRNVAINSGNIYLESDGGIIISTKDSSDLLNANGGTTTLKTINGQSLLGEGDIEISGGGVSGDYLPLTGGTLTGPINLNSSTSGNATLNFTSVKFESAYTGSYGEYGRMYIDLHSEENSGNSHLSIKAPESADSNILTARLAAGSNDLIIRTGGITLKDKTTNDLLNAAGSTSTLKTINGQSLIGTGDITIEGGTGINNSYVFDLGSISNPISEEEYNKLVASINANDVILIKNDTNLYSTSIKQDNDYYYLCGSLLDTDNNRRNIRIYQVSVSKSDRTFLSDNGSVSLRTNGTGNAFLSDNGSYQEISSSYVLPIASDTTLGGIKIGTGLNISEDGTVTVNIPTDYVTNSTLTTTLQSYETTQHASDTYQVKGDYVTTDLLTSLINRITALEQALTLKNI